MRLFPALVLLTCTLLVGAPPHAAATELSQIVKLSDGVYRTALSNGVPVYFYPLAGPPITEVQLWVRAGSRHDPPGMRGMSHLLEHLFYRGTTTRGDFEGRKAILATGGESEGGTWYDWQFHRAKVPMDDLAIPIEVFCDALQNLTLTDESIVIEQQIVLRELETRADDPETRLWNATMAAAYQSGPYAEPVMGTPDSVMACSPEAIRGLYASRFGTNHIAFVVSGAFDEREVIAQLEEGLVGLRTGEEETVLEPIGEELREPTIETVTIPGVAPEIRIGFRVPGAATESTRICETLPSMMMPALDAQLPEGGHKPMVEYRGNTAGGLLLIRQPLTADETTETQLTRLLEALRALPLQEFASRLLESGLPRFDRYVPFRTNPPVMRMEVGDLWATTGSLKSRHERSILGLVDDYRVLLADFLQAGRMTTLLVNCEAETQTAIVPREFLNSPAIDANPTLWAPVFETPDDSRSSLMPSQRLPMLVQSRPVVAALRPLANGATLVQVSTHSGARSRFGPLPEPMPPDEAALGIYFDVGSMDEAIPREIAGFLDELAEESGLPDVRTQVGRSNAWLRVPSTPMTLSYAARFLAEGWIRMSAPEASRIPHGLLTDAPLTPERRVVESLWETIYPDFSRIHAQGAEPLTPAVRGGMQRDLAQHLQAIVLVGGSESENLDSVPEALQPLIDALATVEAEAPDERLIPFEPPTDSTPLAFTPVPADASPRTLLYSAKHPEIGMGGSAHAAGILFARALEWRLVEELVYEKALAYDVRVERLSIGAPGALALVIDADPADHAAIRVAIDALLAEVAATPFTDDDLATLQRWAAGNLLLQSESIEATTHQIGMALVHDKPWNAFIDPSVAIDMVTLDDLNTLRASLLDPEH